MKLLPIPKIMEEDYDTDSLVYNDDDTLYYNEDVDENLIDDIKNKNIQVYAGYYTFSKGYESPKIYLIGRGKKCGKIKFKIEGFLPYCYIKKKDGEYTDYLGNKVEKLTFKGMHPSRIARFRDIRRKKGFPLPYEADILFVRRFLIDMYDYFKPKKAIEPRVAILDIENNYPESQDLIAWALNSEDELIYESKYDDLYPSEMALDIYEKLQEYDVVTGWNIEFDIYELCKKKKRDEDLVLDKINHFLNYARNNMELTKEEYIKGMGDRYFSKAESSHLIELLLDRGYLKEKDEIIILGDKEFNPVLSESISIIDMLKMSQRMHAQEIRGKWTLGNVGVQLAGIDKIHIGAKQIRELDEDDLLEYNVRDVLIPDILDNMLGGMQALNILAWSLQSTLEDVTITAVVNDIAMLRAYHREKIILPSRDYVEDDKKAKYKAAEPDAKPGVYKGLITLDIKHAYPSAVISKNISPETKDVNGRHITPNGIRFNDNKSVFIETLKNLMEERKKIKEKMNGINKNTMKYKKLKSVDFALKTQAAAFSHGIFGWTNSRMKDMEVADSITAVVREILNLLKDACEKIDVNWCYTHTDAIYTNSKKRDKLGLVGYLNDIIEDYCKDDLFIPELEFKNYYPYSYIHSPARNVLVPEGCEIDDDENWDVTGCNFMRSETSPALGNIEIKMIKLLMKGATPSSLIYQLRKEIKKLKDVDSLNLGVIKPLSKPIKDYGKKLLDGTHGNIPYHISALNRANKEYGFSVKVKEKFGVLPILTDETTGKKKIRRKCIFMAYDTEKGLPDKYTIDMEYYLRSNLWGKINTLFNMKPKELEKSVLTKEIKECLNIPTEDEN